MSENHLESGGSADELIEKWTAPGRLTRLRLQLQPRKQFYRIATIAILLSVWTAVYEFGIVNQAFFASPPQIATWYWNNLLSPDVVGDVIVTMREALYGWAGGSLLGITVGLALSRYRTAWFALSPALTFLNAVPRTALAPIFILWFGIAEIGKVILAATIVFFMVLLPTHAAGSSLDPDLDLAFRTLGASERQRFFKFVLPSVLTSVFGALRLASVWALLGASYAELFGAERGLGIRYITATGVLRMDEAFAVTTLLAFLALLINFGVSVLEKRLLRWRELTLAGSVLTV